jgi:hypothetical protein
MNLINDIDLVSELVGGEIYLIAKRTDVVDAPVAGSVDLNQVQRPAFADRDTGMALIVRLAVDRRFAVNGFRENSGRAGFACASRTAKQIRMGYSVSGDRSLKCLCDRLLAHYIGEFLRSPLSV